MVSKGFQLIKLSTENESFLIKLLKGSSFLKRFSYFLCLNNFVVLSECLKTVGNYNFVSVILYSKSC